MNVIYAFQSITQLTVGREPLQRELKPRSPWMLLGIAGSGQVYTASDVDETKRLTPGSAMLGDASAAVASITLHPETSEGEWKLYWIEFAELRIVVDPPEPLVDAFSGATLSEAAETSWFSEGGVAYAAQADELATLAERLYFAMHMRNDDPRQRLTAHMLVQQMMVWWLGEGTRRTDDALQPTTEQSVMNVAHYMEDHYAEAMSREQLAGMAGVADAYFSNLFKKLIGMQPSVYLERLRVHRAMELLLEERGRRRDLAVVARQSGFRDSWYMSKRFRGITGVGPSLFRSQFQPQRIASLQYPYTHHLLALGIIPVAARFSHGTDSVQGEAGEGVTAFPALLSIEGQRQLLAASEPQLILTYDTADKQARWRGVAPVAYIPWLGTDWRGHLRAIARLLRREPEAEACLGRLDGLAGEIRERLRERLPPRTTISVYKLENDRCYLYGVRDVGCIFYELLGFEPPALIKNKLTKEPNLHSVEIPMRHMAENTGDLNIVILSPDSDRHSHFLQTNEHWRAFEVAASHRLLYLDYREWLHYDPVHIEKQLRRICDILEASNKNS